MRAWIVICDCIFSRYQLWLKDIALRSPGRGLPVKVLILRSERAKRNFRNTPALLSELSAKVARVKPYYGNESLIETISLFRDAEQVVGYHGAGFANILFSGPYTRATEMFVRGCKEKKPSVRIFTERVSYATGQEWTYLPFGVPSSGSMTRCRFVPEVVWNETDLADLVVHMTGNQNQ